MIPQKKRPAGTLEDPRFDIADLLVTDSSVCSIRTSQLEDIHLLKACSFIGTSHRHSAIIFRF
jgi:hypothetical protein